jgi:hypothetical protein
MYFISFNLSEVIKQTPILNDQTMIEDVHIIAHEKQN